MRRLLTVLDHRCDRGILPGDAFGRARPGRRPSGAETGRARLHLVALPTSLRLPTFSSAFRVTHRFTRPLGDGDFGDLAADLFGIDSGAVIGLDTGSGSSRTDRSAFTGRATGRSSSSRSTVVLRQGQGLPSTCRSSPRIDGTNNFKDSYSPAIGAIVSRSFGDIAAVYLEPIWVNNSNELPKELTDHNDTFLVGIGARVRIRPTVYVVGEVVPRSGYKPGVNHGSFAIEKRAGGHTFQLNFSNAIGTTMGQIARGGPDEQRVVHGISTSRASSTRMIGWCGDSS